MFNKGSDKLVFRACNANEVLVSEFPLNTLLVLIYLSWKMSMMPRSSYSYVSNYPCLTSLNLIYNMRKKMMIDLKIKEIH